MELTYINFLKDAVLKESFLGGQAAGGTMICAYNTHNMYVQTFKKCTELHKSLVAGSKTIQGTFLKKPMPYIISIVGHMHRLIIHRRTVS
jgi:hypothetical protein